MLLARNLYSERYEVAYDSGTKLKSTQAEAIKKAGYSGSYILDAASDEVVADPIIPDESYLLVARSSDRYSVQARSEDRENLRVTQEEQEAIVLPVIEALRAKPNLVIEAIDTKPYEGYDDFHAAMVMIISLALGIKMELDDKQLFELGIAALLHDIGNALLPLHLLHRPGKLTDEEYELIKQHVEKGYDYLVSNCSLPAPASLGAMQHHENYDGTGYPNGLRRKNISVYGRVIAIADTYDALISKRSFRAALYPMQALDMVQQHADRKFDPDIVETLTQIIAPYPVGTVVQLRTGEQCLVLRNHPEDLTHPLLEHYTGRARTHRYIDLRTDTTYKNVRITKIIDG
jgi:HD-GYP domain-containing protein (c-di-GMP phosphodiesterase class II)